jgi:hypothetical protein
MLSENERLDYKTLADIFKSGFSRIPVYGKDTNDIKGDVSYNIMSFTNLWQLDLIAYKEIRISLEANI